jgi:hypothetical protein
MSSAFQKFQDIKMMNLSALKTDVHNVINGTDKYFVVGAARLMFHDLVIFAVLAVGLILFYVYLISSFNNSSTPVMIFFNSLFIVFTMYVSTAVFTGELLKNLHVFGETK